METTKIMQSFDETAKFYFQTGPKKGQMKEKYQDEIRKRYKRGDKQVDLEDEYGATNHRIRVILGKYKPKNQKRLWMDNAECYRDKISYKLSREEDRDFSKDIPEPEDEPILRDLGKKKIIKYILDNRSDREFIVEIQQVINSIMENNPVLDYID